jgi:hypothetical protein
MSKQPKNPSQLGNSTQIGMEENRHFVKPNKHICHVILCTKKNQASGGATLPAKVNEFRGSEIATDKRWDMMT